MYRPDIERCGGSGGLAPLAGTLTVGVGGAAAAIGAWGFQLAGGEVALGAEAFTTVLIVTLALLGLALTVLGTWLRSEHPADDTAPFAIA
jgi:hypothetical protein